MPVAESLMAAVVAAGRRVLAAPVAVDGQEAWVVPASREPQDRSAAEEVSREHRVARARQAVVSRAHRTAAGWAGLRVRRAAVPVQEGGQASRVGLALGAWQVPLVPPAEEQV